MQYRYHRASRTQLRDLVHRIGASVCGFAPFDDKVLMIKLMMLTV